MIFFEVILRGGKVKTLSFDELQNERIYSVNCQKVLIVGVGTTGRKVVHEMEAQYDVLNLDFGEEAEQIRGALSGIEKYETVLLVSSLGGVRGAEALPDIIREIEKNNRNVIAVFVMPFKFEGVKVLEKAGKVLEEMQGFLTAYTLYDNNKAFDMMDNKMTAAETLEKANEDIRSRCNVIISKLDEVLEGV